MATRWFRYAACCLLGGALALPLLRGRSSWLESAGRARLSVVLSGDEIVFEGTPMPHPGARFLQESYRSLLPWGNLSRLRLLGFDRDGAEVPMERTTSSAGGAEFRLPPQGRFELRYPLHTGFVDGNLRFAWFDGAGKNGVLSLASHAFSSAGDVPHVEAPGLVVAEDLLERGLLRIGPNWQEWTEPFHLFVAPEIDTRLALETGRYLACARERLASLGFGTGAREPIAVLLPMDPTVACTDLGLAAQGVCVVELTSRGPVPSTVTRDLARAAVLELSARRPAEELGLWKSLALPLAIELGVGCELEGAEVPLEAAWQAYTSDARVGTVLAEDVGKPGALAWFVEEVTSPVAWADFCARARREHGLELADVLRLATRPESAGIPLPRLLAEAHGPGIGRLFEEYFYSRQYHVPRREPSARGFPFLPDPADETASCPGPDSLRVLLSSMSMGFLDSCGCALNQDGGLPKRAGLVEAERRVAPELVLLELGDFLAPPLSQHVRSRRQAEGTLDVLAELHYDAIVPGLAELSYPSEWLLAARDERDLPLLAANLRWRGSDVAPYPAVRRIRSTPVPIHVLGLVEPTYERYRYAAVERLVLEQYRLEPAFEAALAHLSEARAEDIWIVAGALLPETVRRLLAHPLASRIDAVFSNSWSMALALGEEREGLLHLKTRPDVGLYGSAFYAYQVAERFGLTRVLLPDRSGPGRGLVEPVQLNGEVPRSASVDRILTRIAREEAGDVTSWVPSPLAHAPLELDAANRYLGAETCKACHVREYDSWKRSGHSRAISALASRGKDFDPACLRCHTTGFLVSDGYDPRDPERKRFENVQCEVCHGPGSRHVASAANAGASAPHVRRQVEPELCQACHDEENSPDFDFEQRLPRIDHR